MVRFQEILIEQYIKLLLNNINLCFIFKASLFELFFELILIN